MNKKSLDEYRNTLEEFLSDYEKYVERPIYRRDELRTKLQRKLTLVSNIIAFVHGGGSLKLDESTSINFYQALSYSLTDTIPDSERRNFIESNVESTLNEAIGNIVNGTIPSKEIKPVLPIADEDLKSRCSDLLNAPGYFDRVILVATVVLEDRLRSMVSREQLAALIPLYADQTLEKLINHLVSPEKPVICVSPNKGDRVAFHRMMLGICAYLRNPFHHSLDNKTEWALAWSVTGLIDSLLYDLSKSQVLDVPKKDKEKKQME